jgi:CobQ/CobB/MinD/ParA nucleotide binding domain
MDVRAFCHQSRVLIVAGKGGVGKTTVSAVVARMAATAGLDVLIVELEGKSGLGAAFGHEGGLGYDEVLLQGGGGQDGGTGSGRVRARTLTPDEALLEYLADHGLGRVSKRLVSSGALDVVATAAPGIRDILVLGKVKQLEQRREADLIVVDAPAAGHTLTFLTSASGLMDAVRVGPIRVQAGDVIELLTDGTRCQLVLVTLPEETPVNEVVETAYKLEDRVGISLGPVVVNAVYPVIDGLEEDPGSLVGDIAPAERSSLAAAARFRSGRQRLQAAQIKRLADALPLPQIVLPFVFSGEVGATELEAMSAAMTEGVAALPDDPSRSSERQESS